MSHLILQPTETAQWHTLVKEAENNSHLMLGEELESYLVFLLVRFTAKPEIAKSVLGLDFLHCAQVTGYQKHDELREVGDKCLLIAGLSPAVPSIGGLVSVILWNLGKVLILCWPLYLSKSLQCFINH